MECHGGSNIAIHFDRADATNAKVWAKQKLHTCEITSRYVLGRFDPDVDVTSRAFQVEHCRTNRLITDCQTV
eukprot:10415716-Lingulodinium_polyedra.AAC.1